MPRLQVGTLGSAALLSLLVGSGACATGNGGEYAGVPGEDTGGEVTPTDSTRDDTTPADTGDSTVTDATSDGVSDTSDAKGDGLDCSLGCPPDMWDIDGNPLTGPCGCEYACKKKGATDPIDPDYTDDNCDGSDGVVEKCVYVTGTGVDDPTGGGRKTPVKTIAFAITRAKALGVDVCLAGESFAGLVSMESGVSVYGGFDPKDPDFAWKRSSKVTTTLTAVGTVVEAPKIDSETHLEGHTINAQAPTGVAASAYGVRFAGGSGSFYVRYNKITAADGTDGTDGVDGTAGADGGTGAKGGDGCNGC
jgi:hypothetical protein